MRHHIHRHRSAPAEMSLDQAIIGRDAELAFLVDAVDRAPAGDRLVMLTGVPGAGKSTLLKTVAGHARAAGVQVLRCTGSESEANLAFAGLHQLLRPFLGDAGRLPGRQRAALLGAVGLGPAPERFDPMLVGVAVLTLLSDLADRAPVLIAADDAQWIDGASLDAMAFAARRLDMEPVTVIVGTRGGSPLPGFDTDRVLELDPLDEAAAGRLLDAQPGEPSGRLRRRILQQAGGNPLALVELARAAASDRVGLDAALAGPLPLTERLERIFARALAGLPEATRRSLLLLAAADDADPASGVAMALPDTDDEAWSPAQDAGLVRQIDRRIRFHHPLIRSAVYNVAPFDARRDVHLTLAAALRDEPDRRAWHLAAATLHQDAEVAAALERTADRARSRGGYAAAATALERAAELSPVREDAARRLVAAAEAAVFTGRLDWVEELAAKTGALTTDPAVRLSASLQVGRLMALTQRHSAAFSLLARNARAAAGTDPATALELLSGAAVVRFYSGLEDERREIRRILRSVRAGSGDEEPLRVWVTVVADPFAARADALDELPRLLSEWGGRPDRLTMLAIVAWMLDETPLAVRSFDAALDQWSNRSPLPNGLGCAAALAYLDHGNWTQAHAVCAEVAAIAAETGLDHAAACASAVDAMVLALRGRTAEARARADEALKLIDPSDSRSVAVYARRGLGAAALADGDHETAYEQFRLVFDSGGEPVHYHASCAAVADLAAAAARSGHRTEATSIVEQLAGTLGPASSPRLTALISRARALLADPDRAEAHFRQALAEPVEQWPFERAETLLDYAEWLRRRRRISDARPMLAAALERFRHLGARPWAERAEAELRAAGMDVVPPLPDALADLSPQQQRIIRLAAQGLTNREIGERLYLSPRTVSSHLYRVFPKLGVTARSQLRDLVEGMSMAGGNV